MPVMPGEALLTSDRADRDRWLAIELRHLAALATVAQQASFSGAADSLGYVQSAVSQQISSLERIVGRRLVDRSARPRSVTVTDAGRTLLDHIDDILEQLRLAKADVDALNRRPERAVSFGIANIFGTWLAATMLGALLPEAGGDGWEVVEPGGAAHLLRAVEAEALDAAFVPLPIASGPFFALELTRQPHVLAVPAPAGTGHSTVEAILEQWPPVDIDDCPATKELLERHGAARSCHSATGAASALPLVRSGAAVAVMTALDVPVAGDTVTTLPLPELPDRIVGIAWHRERDDCPAVVSLREAARSAFREFDGRSG
jgi:DNA-binding transcriptional LysR family regulator